MLAVYEEKEKEGKLVRKVRLVADGRSHRTDANTYSSTPSREELLILLHIFATNDWVYYHVDEIRAFLSAEKQEKSKIYAKFSGDPTYYEIIKALYGLKTASKDYQDSVVRRLESLGFQRLHLCSCIFSKHQFGSVVLVYAYVDDFIIGGNNNAEVNKFITQFRDLANTTEPIKDAGKLLGMEIYRNKENKTVQITMEKRISDLEEKYPDACFRRKNAPMPVSGFLVRDYELESLAPEMARLLNEKEQLEYLSIVGSLVWIQGIRFDIIFAVLYLTWFTHSPRQHHMKMAFYVIGYLSTTKYMPLVLGGDEEITPIGYSDASLGTGPKSRSVAGHMTKLNSQAGAINAKSAAQQSTRGSSWEAELDGVSIAMKTLVRVLNILAELDIQHTPQATLFNDNLSMIEFVHGKGVAKGVRHMELRMWYVREQYKNGKISLEYMKGEDLPADKLTKLGNVEDHRRFAAKIMGHTLLQLPEANHDWSRRESLNLHTHSTSF